MSAQQPPRRLQPYVGDTFPQLSLPAFQAPSDDFQAGGAFAQQPSAAAPQPDVPSFPMWPAQISSQPVTNPMVQLPSSWTEIPGIHGDREIIYEVCGAEQELHILEDAVVVAPRRFVPTDAFGDQERFGINIARQLGLTPEEFLPLWNGQYLQNPWMSFANMGSPPFAGRTFDVDWFMCVLEAVGHGFGIQPGLGILTENAGELRIQNFDVDHTAPVTHRVFLQRQIQQGHNGNAYEEAWVSFEYAAPEEPEQPAQRTSVKAAKKPKLTPVRRFKGMTKTPLDFNGHDKLTVAQLVADETEIPSNYIFGETLLRIAMEYRSHEIRDIVNHKLELEGLRRRVTENTITQRIRNALIGRAERLGLQAQEKQIRTEWLQTRNRDAGSKTDVARQDQLGYLPVRRSARRQTKLQVRQQAQRAAATSAEGIPQQDEQTDAEASRADDSQGEQLDEVEAEQAEVDAEQANLGAEVGSDESEDGMNGATDEEDFNGDEDASMFSTYEATKGGHDDQQVEETVDESSAGQEDNEAGSTGDENLLYNGAEDQLFYQSDQDAEGEEDAYW